MAGITYCSRTKIVVNGLPEKRVKQIIGEVLGDYFVSAKTITTKDEVVIYLYPFRVVEVYYRDVIPIPVSTNSPYQYKLLVEGGIPLSDGYGGFCQSGIIYDMWMPIRNSSSKKSQYAGKNPCLGLSREEKKDLSKLALTFKVSELEDCSVLTQMVLEADARLYEPTRGLSAEERVVRALDNATDLLGEEIRKFFESVSMYRLDAAVTLEGLSMRLAEALEQATDTVA